MATKVELTSPLSSRTPQASLSDILNEVNTPRTYTSPLSDASNKSNDSSLTSPIITAETDNLASKSVSMLTVRSRPRLSPKPFSKEKPPDYRIGRNLMPFVSNDTPSRLATSTSENKQNNDSERMNRRIFRDSQQQSIEEKEATKAVAASFASTAEIQMQNPSNLGTPTNTAENVAFTSRSNEKEPSPKPEVPTKPPVISNALEKLQPKDTTSHLPSSRIYPSDVATEKNNKSSLEFESQDSSSVRAQLRPRRRPVSAVFLESINDPAPDRSEATDEKTCGRKPRPLSVDLTAKFETRGSLVHKNSFDETKENMPLKKDPTCSSITEENSELSLKQDGGLHEVRSKNHGNGSSRCQTTTEVFNRNKQSETSVKESVLNNTTKEKKDQDFGDGGETQSKVHLTEKSNARSTLQEGKPLFPESQVQPSDDIGITPGTINRRISLLLANSGSSVEVSESSTPEQGKGSSNVQQRIRGYSSENVEIKLSKTQTFLQPQDHSSELTKTLSNSQPNEEIKETKTKEQQTFNVSSDSKKTMDTKDSQVSEEKQWTSWRSLRKSDWYQQSEASPDVPIERKSSLRKSNWNQQSEASPDAPIESKSSLRKSDWYPQSEASPDDPIESKSSLRKSNWNQQSEASPDVPIERKSSLRKSDWYQQSEASPDVPIERKSSLRKSNWNQQSEASPDAPIESKSSLRKSDWYPQSEASPDDPIESKSSLKKSDWYPQSEASPDVPIERKSSLRKSNWNQQSEASPDAPIESKSSFRKSDWYPQSEASPDAPIESKSSLRKSDWYPQSEASPDAPIESKSSLRKSDWYPQSEASPDDPIESISSLRKSDWYPQSEASPDVPIERKSSLRKSDWYPQSEASPDAPIESKSSLRKSDWYPQSEASPDAPIESKSSLRKSDWYPQSEASPDAPIESKSSLRKSDWYPQSEASPDDPIESKSSLRKSNWNQQSEASPDVPIERKSSLRKSDWYPQSEASPDAPIESKSSLRKSDWYPQSEASPDVPIERKSSLRKLNWNPQSEASPDVPIERKSSLRKSNWNQQSEASPDAPIESKSSLRKSEWYPQSEASPDVPIERKSSLRKSDWYRQSEAYPDVPNERKSLSSKEKTFDIATENTSEMEKIAGGNEFRTVRATMFEHNIERHNIERHSVNESGFPRQTVPDKHTKIKSPANESRGWTDCQEGDNSAKYQQGTEMLNTIIPQAGVLEKSSYIASHSPYTCTNVEVDLSKQRIEPRYEIVQTIGEKVSSESIQLLPEQNVRTLRSRRSFSRKEIEQERSKLDGDMHDRPWSRLQRSKSEYRKRNTQGSSQGSFKDKDFNLEDKYDFRAEIRPPIIATADNVFKTDRTGLTESKADALKIYAVQDKDYKTEKAKLWEESKLWAHLKEKESSKGLEHSSFRSPAENQTVSGKELQGGGQRDFLKSQTYHASKGSAENDAQIASMIDSKDETGVYGEQFHSSRVRNFKENENQPYRSFIKNDLELLHKSTSRDESMDVFESVLNNGIEQMKKNLSAHSSSMETKLDSRIDEYFTEQKWKREKLFPLNDSSKVENTSDLITSTTNEVSTRNRGVADKNQDILNKFPQDTKATYFAVTCFDKKEKNESDLGTSINFQSGNLVVKEDSNNRLYVASHNNFYSDSGDGKQDFQIRRESNIKSTSRCQAIVESDFTVKSDVMGSEILRPNTIDLDLLQERHRQEPYVEESRLTYQDSSAELSAKDYDHKSDNKSHREAEQFDLKGTYRSQVVDIDALMVDYKVSQNNNPDQGKSWEMSRSFRECSEKNDSRKWKDPDVKPFTYKEGIKYETVSSWYTSQEHSEHELKTEDLKFTQFKNEGQSTDFTNTVETDNLKHQSISKNIRTLDALLDSSRGRQRDHKSSTSLLQNSYDLETERQPSKSFTKEAGFIELSVDDEDDIKLKHQTAGDIRLKHQTPSQTASKSSVVEKKPAYSERRRPAKSTDLVALILEDKERRRQNRLKQGPTDEYNAQPLSRRHFSEQEHIQSGNKRHSQDYSTSIYHSKTVEVVTESSHRRSAKQQRGRAELPQLDQLKQCVTRSSTTNKDTDSLVQESDKRYGTWSQEQQQSEDGFVADSPSFGDISNRKHTPQSRLSSVSQSETDQHDFLSDPKSSAVDASSMDIDSTDGTGSTISLHEAKAEDFSFIDQTLVLDSTALKTRVQLNRKSQRRAPSQSQRKSRLLLSSSHLDVIEDTDSPWMYTDSTEEKPVKEESEEEKPQRTPVQQQRMPMFPGMDPSALKAQLRKRQDPENNSESPSQPSRSPKSPLPQGTLGIKLLPTSSDKQERGPEESPAWLKELKSKKRLSQYENQT
ncbi:uncharacterized protein LOC108715698 isoform X2 [Xenopus laevis]|uniref:Uncharacterized protein LOC108715698 isoform X2 n=1 Tax=Xenopus laevis TaxID=8355 RepID=A0A8J1KXI8_XENLA|nr:uncharacterized protein LOC108715698 isoform X2 [Xenopus laevis]